MKAGKREAGMPAMTATTIAAITRSAGTSGSASSNSGAKPRKAASRESGAGGRKKPAAQTMKGRKKLATGARSPNLTAVRVANIISQLDNKRGSTMESIRSKLIRSGFKTNTPMIRVALERAVKSGLLREIREERFSLPHRSGSRLNSSSSTASSSGRNNAKVARRVSSKGQQPHYHQSRRQAVTSASRSSAKRLQRRRPPQGRRPANATDSATEENDDDGRDRDNDNDAGVGDGDVEADSGSGHGIKNATGSRVSVSEPVAGCDAVMVFGTH